MSEQLPRRKYTVFTSVRREDGALIVDVYPDATMEAIGDEYVFHDSLEKDTHWGHPMVNVRRVKEEPRGT
jgi:hypothetical protein